MGNIVKAVVGKNGKIIKTAPLYQYDYGQILQIEGIELPAAYQVHFSNDPMGDSTTSIGDESGVTIPDTYLASGETVYAWLYLHTGEDDGETVLNIVIPVRQRAAITNETPTPQQQGEIDQIIEELNEAVDAAEDAQAAAEEAAEQAEAQVEKYPIIVDGYWAFWDEASEQYVKSNQKAQGPKGDPGDPGDPTELIDDTSTGLDKAWSAAKSNTLLSALQVMDSFEYKFSGTDLLIAFGFTDTDDYVIVMNNGRANDLFDFAKLCTKPKGTLLKNLETADLTTVWTSGTDFHGPFKFLATSNADGYHSDATTPGFTGGNHTLDGLGNNFKTASSVYVKYYADGIPVSSGYGKANSFEIRWANDVQAYNTVKQGGGGRACLREHHDMVFDGVKFSEKITLEPLEEISLRMWYGLQCASIGATYGSIAFVDATNRGVFAYNDQDVKSGNAATSGLNCWGNGHRLEMSVDTNIDLGKRTYYSGDSGAFCTTTKGYFYIIGQTITMAKGALYYLHGSYRFLQDIVVGVPCTGITLDSNTLTFESAEETKTLTATVTPADTTESVEWSSSNEDVATVSNGVVTIHGIGTATITATCGSQTATATINQTTLKAQYSMKVVSDKYPKNRTLGEDSVLSISSLEGQKAIGQAYHNANNDLHVYSGQTNDIECIRVPYGATVAKVKTSDDVDVTMSFVYVGDTTNIITYSGVDYAEYVSSNSNVSTNTGLTVAFGQCIIIRVKDEQYPTLQYVYFE